jgi:hypothetical protein
MWALALVASVKKPVDSMTTSAPISFQGSARVLAVGHGTVHPAEDRVVLQQVREGLVVGQVVDPDHLDVGARREERTVVVAADPAEAVDAYPNSHEGTLPGGAEVR